MWVVVAISARSLAHLHPQRVGRLLGHDDVELVLSEGIFVRPRVDEAVSFHITVPEHLPQPTSTGQVEVAPHHLEHPLLDRERKGTLSVPLVLPRRAGRRKHDEIDEIVVGDVSAPTNEWVGLGWVGVE